MIEVRLLVSDSRIVSHELIVSGSIKEAIDNLLLTRYYGVRTVVLEVRATGK